MVTKFQKLKSFLKKIIFQIVCIIIVIASVSYPNNIIFGIGILVSILSNKLLSRVMCNSKDINFSNLFIRASIPFGISMIIIMGSLFYLNGMKLVDSIVHGFIYGILGGIVFGLLFSLIMYKIRNSKS